MQTSKSIASLNFQQSITFYPSPYSHPKTPQSYMTDLRKKGTPVDDIDLLIAGIAIENNMMVITNNMSHFERIEGLEVENWSL